MGGMTWDALLRTPAFRRRNALVPEPADDVYGRLAEGYAAPHARDQITRALSSEPVTWPDDWWHDANYLGNYDRRYILRREDPERWYGEGVLSLPRR